ncbi:VIT domain-containing protein [Bradyrhizobium sp. CB82]|uniref:VIT domain-containing protein n=1 Tax=Bradyrhizobium sp. CB82 TaxID=3039159 RepID=UPI0024B103C3|nr:VIT domain-containing protein [Bradyrhizobium sp. CB82]WFU44145.1 VIT domain-containing protein [Bradyrhizobium sp. CB82]
MGGIAAVTSVRTFRNQESQDIEPTMTFPVPVDAVLCSLKARIDGRELIAVAAPKEEARETYEVAIDGGRSAVLHEELISSELAWKQFTMPNSEGS